VTLLFIKYMVSIGSSRFQYNMGPKKVMLCQSSYYNDNIFTSKQSIRKWAKKEKICLVHSWFMCVFLCILLCIFLRQMLEQFLLPFHISHAL